MPEKSQSARQSRFGVKSILRKAGRAISWTLMLRNIKNTFLWPVTTFKRHALFAKRTVKSNLLLNRQGLDAQTCREADEIERSSGLHLQSAVTWAVFALFVLVLLIFRAESLFAIVGLFLLLVVCGFRGLVDLYISAKAKAKLAKILPHEHRGGKNA